MLKKCSAFILIIAAVLLGTFNSQAQEGGSDDDLIQFSGVVLTIDSLTPVSFANIIIKDSYRGTVSDYYGYFSFVARLGDTIQFSAVGYKTSFYTIPDTLASKNYSLIKIMERDTVMLKETVIYPWPTKEQFKQAFLNLQIPKDDIELARQNLDRQRMQERYEAMGMDASMNYKYYMQQQTDQLYYAGQLPPQNIFNPIAWAQFIQAWKEGKFKRE